MAENKKVPTSVVLFWTGVILVILMGAFFGVFWSKLPPQLPWLYSFPFGEKQLINKFFFVFVFVGAEVMLFLTRMIANWAGKDDETVQNTLMTGVLVAVILMAASFFQIMSIFLNL